MCQAIQMGRSGGHDLGGIPRGKPSLHTQISELEKPGFQYCRMYSENMIQMVSYNGSIQLGSVWYEMKLASVFAILNSYIFCSGIVRIV